MPKPDFAEAVEIVIAKDLRYGRDAYFFLRDALKSIDKHGRKGEGTPAGNHVSGQQLLDGIRYYALKQFGPMVVTVFQYWGIHDCPDFGEMVYNLISVGVFGKTDSDSIEDFRGGYTFQEAFIEPYLPEKRATHRRVRLIRPAKELN